MKNLFVLFAVLLLCSCAPKDARLIDAKNGEEFVRMSRSMRQIMLKKHIVDAKGDWYGPVLSFHPFSAGSKLVSHLSQNFRFADRKDSAPRTIEDDKTEETIIKTDGRKAEVIEGLNRLYMEVIAYTDWNNDGTEDWLVLCRSGYTDKPKVYREYYLAIMDRRGDKWTPLVLGVTDYVFGRAIPVGDVSQGRLAESESKEFIQGQATVTKAPQSGKKPWEATSVKQNRLDN